MNRPASKARRARQHSLTSLPLFLLVLFSISPHSAFAQANPTIGGGGACTGWVASDTTTQGAQLAENDGLYTCQSSAWVPETLVVGSVTQSGGVPTCGAGTAGMLYYTGGTVEYCNGTSFTTFGSSVTLNGILAATGANGSISNGSYAQVWNWSLAGTNHTAITFGEAAAATSGGQIVDITTAGGSTAVPLTITNGATAADSVAINITKGGIAVSGNNILVLPDADTTSIAVGEGALTDQNATSESNTAVGFDAGYYITTGLGNVAIGEGAMTGVSGNPLTGGYNTGIGQAVLNVIQGGAQFNTAVGQAAMIANTTGSSNVAVGERALQANTTGTASTAVGYTALYNNTTGSASTAVGAYALYTASNPNDAVGYQAGYFISTGTANVAIGYEAMMGVSGNPLTGGYNTGIGQAVLNVIQGGAQFNTAVGQAAMIANTTGSSNVAVGERALQANTTGTASTAVGYTALYSATGAPNDALGNDAGYYISTGASNVAIGYESMQGVAATPVTGSSNVAVGTSALYSIQGGATQNVAVGTNALYANTSGGQNIAVGYQALQNATAGGNVAIGYQAMESNGGNPLVDGSNVAVGYWALQNLQGYSNGNVAVGSSALSSVTVSNNFNTAVGNNALQHANSTANDALGNNAGNQITSGTSNVAIGFDAMNGSGGNPTTGSNNTAMGNQAAANLQGAASNNIAIGYQTLDNYTTGSDSTAIGTQALEQTTGAPNDALGYRAGYYITTGANNVALGYQAMQGVSATPLTGNGNTAVGNSALLNAQGAAAGNVALGYQAGNSSNPTTTGTNNVFIGYQAGALNATDTNEIAIGALAMGRGSNSVVIGNGSITDAYFGMTTTCTNGAACGSGSINSNAGAAGAVVLHAAGYNRFSDQRLKKDIQDSDLGLDFILKLRPVSYVLKAGKSLMNYGFIAQEVEKALDGRVTGMVTREKDEMGTYEIDYSSLIAPTVKAVQQQQQEITDDKTDLKQQISVLNSQIADLKQLIAAQQKEIADLKAAHTPPRPHPTYE